MFVFHKLRVWQAAKDITLEIYKVTKNFPEEEKYGLISQLHRASVSIASNIAEGSTRSSTKEQSYFYQMAYGSLMEVACQLEISKDLGFMKDVELNILFEKIEILAKQLSSLRNSITGKKS